MIAYEGSPASVECQYGDGGIDADRQVCPSVKLTSNQESSARRVCRWHHARGGPSGATIAGQ